LFSANRRNAGAFGVARRLALAPVVVGLILLLAVGVGPLTGRYRVVTVLSGSMQPSMPIGSMIVDTPMPRTAVRPGQVITYQTPLADHRVVSHRVVRVTQNGDHPIVTTKGDANNGVDPWDAQLSAGPAWRVRTAIPYAGYGVLFLRQPLVHRISAWLVPSLLALTWLTKIWRSQHAES
jgi:signal peptidase